MRTRKSIPIICLSFSFFLLWIISFYGVVPFAMADGEVVFASVDDMSGPFSHDGDENVKATTLALEEVGYKVVGKKIKYVTRDTQLKPDVGVRKFREVVEQEHPVYIGSGASSAVQLAMQPVAAETKTLFWFHGWATPLTTAGTVNRYSFRWSGTDWAVAHSVVTGFIKKFPRAKNFCAITMDYAWGHSMFKEAKEVIEESGGKIIDNVLTPVKETDYTGAITKALSAKPDVLLLILYGDPLIKCARTAHEFGAKNKAIVLIPADGLQMLRGIGSEALEGMYTGNQWWHRIDNKVSKEFVSRFKNKYGKVPSYYALAHYTAVTQTIKAMERSRSTDVDKVICALEGHKYEGATGMEEIRAFDHQVVHPLFLCVGKKPSEKEYADDYLNIVGSAMIYRTYAQNPVVWKEKLPCDKK
jgi:branched-chain amino acid transport system substrate-binding protein